MSRRDYLKYLGFQVAIAQIHLKELKQPPPMTPNDKLPEEMQEQIKRTAKHLSGLSTDEETTPFKKGFYSGYLSGATAWVAWKISYDEVKKSERIVSKAYAQALIDRDEMKAQAQRMADALEQCSNVASWMDDPYRNKIGEVVSKALQQFKDGTKGKEGVIKKNLHSGNKHKWQDDWDIDEQGELNEETD